MILPVAHRLRADGTTLCGADFDPRALLGDVRECPHCARTSHARANERHPGHQAAKRRRRQAELDRYEPHADRRRAATALAWFRAWIESRGATT